MNDEMIKEDKKLLSEWFLSMLYLFLWQTRRKYIERPLYVPRVIYNVLCIMQENKWFIQFIAVNYSKFNWFNRPGYTSIH